MNTKQRILAITVVLLMAVFLCLGIYGLWNYMQDKIGNLLTSDTVSSGSTVSNTEEDPNDFNFDDSDNGDYSTTSTFSFKCRVKGDSSFLSSDEISNIEQFLNHVVFGKFIGKVNVSCIDYSNATFNVTVKTDFYYTDNEFENLISKIETTPCVTIGGYYDRVTITRDDIINIETYMTDDQDYTILANLSDIGAIKFKQGFASAESYLQIYINNTDIFSSEKYEFIDDNTVIFGDYDSEFSAEEVIQLIEFGLSPYEITVFDEKVERP